VTLIHAPSFDGSFVPQPVGTLLVIHGRPSILRLSGARSSHVLIFRLFLRKTSLIASLLPRMDELSTSFPNAQTGNPTYLRCYLSEKRSPVSLRIQACDHLNSTNSSIHGTSLPTPPWDPTTHRIMPKCLTAVAHGWAFTNSHPLHLPGSKKSMPLGSMNSIT
jgi:hypothetical protein